MGGFTLLFLFLALNKQDWIWWMGLTKPEGLVALHFFPLSNSKQFSLHDIWWISKWVLNYVYVKFLYYSNDFIFHRSDLPPSFTPLWMKLLFNFKPNLVLSVWSFVCSFHEKMCIYIIRIPCSVGSFVSIQFFAFGP